MKQNKVNETFISAKGFHAFGQKAFVVRSKFGKDLFSESIYDLKEDEYDLNSFKAILNLMNVEELLKFEKNVINADLINDLVKKELEEINSDFLNLSFVGVNTR